MLHERRERLVLPERHRSPVGDGSAARGPDSDVVVRVGAVGDVGRDLLTGRVRPRGYMFWGDEGKRY